MVRVERRRVAVVVVDDGQPQPRLQRAAEVETLPAGVREVRGAAGGDDAVGAGRPRGVEPDLGPFLDAAGRLDQAIHQPALRGMKDGGVVLVPSVVEPDDDRGVVAPHWNAPSSAVSAAGTAIVATVVA